MELWNSGFECGGKGFPVTHREGRVNVLHAAFVFQWQCVTAVHDRVLEKNVPAIAHAMLSMQFVSFRFNRFSSLTLHLCFVMVSNLKSTFREFRGVVS